jgi:glutamate---cysteine ligase / carboxylate-amine ligase
MSSLYFTVGIEEEYQIIDPATRELTSYVTRILEDGRSFLHERVKPEMHQSQIEIGTAVHKTIQDARADMIYLRQAVIRLAGRRGVNITAAGTHPFSSWRQSQITPFDRYLGLAKDLGVLAQQLLIFGTHVHIGVEDPDLRIDLMNQARNYLAPLLALSTSSPFWEGRDTGLKSYRSIIFRSFPRTGIPPTFNSYQHFAEMLETLMNSGCIEDGTKLWWDIRPSVKYPTIEFRVCDACTRVDETLCIAAITQALVAKLYRLRRDGLTLRLYPRELLYENKWRAMRYGLDGELIDFTEKRAIPAREAVSRLLEFIDDVVDDLSSRREIEYAQTILREGTSADRQLRRHREGGDLRAVVDLLIEETMGDALGKPDRPLIHQLADRS